MDEASVQLLGRWRQGDQQAAEELFHRYGAELIRLAGSRLSAQVARRVDAEDVVQSAYRSFFCGAREGRYELQRGGDLWRLLVAITLHKLQHQVRFNKAEKRTVDRERALEKEATSPHLADSQPSPVETLALVEEIEWVMGQLEPHHRRILELRLQGHNLEEIAAAADRTERTVSRVLERVRGLLLREAAAGTCPTAEAPL